MSKHRNIHTYTDEIKTADLTLFLTDDYVRKKLVRL